MFFKKLKHKNFDYRPRYYDPLNDPDERKKRKLQISRERKYKKKGFNIVYILVLILIIIFYIVSRNN
jgi:hypothetical protein